MVQNRIIDLLDRLDMITIRNRFVEPRFLDKFPEVQVMGKFLALIVLPIIMIFTMALTVVIQIIVSSVLTVIGPDTLMEFISSFIGFAVYLVFNYGWFQWVRSGGFGVFAFNF